MTSIGDVTDRVRTWNPLNAPGDSEFDYVDLSAVDNERKRILAANRVRASDAPSRARQLIEAGDTLVSTVRPNLNAVAMVPSRLHGATASTGFTVLRPTEQVDGRYLFHWVRSPAFVDDMVRKATGASYPAVSDRIVKESTIPLPSLGEQRRIAAILDQADAVRAKRQESLVRLDDLTQSIFIDMFGADAFPAVPAGELMPRMRNGLSPATAGEHSATVLTLSAVTQGAFDPLAVKHGVFAVEPPQDKRVSAGDFLMCRGNGNLALVGAGVFSAVDRAELVFPDTVIAGRVDAARVELPYLNAAWKQPEVRRQIASVARTTNGTYKVNQKTLSSVLVPLPPVALQRAFTDRIARVSAQRAATIRATAIEHELLASLQARAFAGDL
jgi:type I restriction enzyme S subunit